MPGAAAPRERRLPNAAPDDLGSEMREVMWVSPDQSTAEGRWFWGEYQEFGFDVKMQRASADPTLIGVDRSLLKTGSQGTRVRLIGGKLAGADCARGSGFRNRRDGEAHRFAHAHRNRGGSGRGGGRGVRANGTSLSAARCCKARSRSTIASTTSR